MIERERIRLLGLHTLESFAHEWAAASRIGQAIDAAFAAIAGEPARESTPRTLVEVHLAAGNRVEALRHFERSTSARLGSQERSSPVRATLCERCASTRSQCCAVIRI